LTETDSQLADYDSLFISMQRVSERVDDFSASLYPPCDVNELSQETGPLVDYMNSIINSYR